MARRPVGRQSLLAGGSRQLTVLVDNEMHDELGRLAALNGESICAAVRRAINQLLAGEIVDNTPGRRLLLARMLHDELGGVLDGLIEDRTTVRLMGRSADLHRKHPHLSSSEPTSLGSTLKATDQQGVA